MTPEPNKFKLEQDSIPQNWKEAVVNPEVWGKGTYTCKITTKSGKEIYGYLTDFLGSIQIPVYFDKQVPDRALHLYSELMQAHITFDLVKKDMNQINSRRIDTSSSLNAFAELGISSDSIQTATSAISLSVLEDYNHSGQETRLYVRYESKDIYKKLTLLDIAQGLETDLGWKVEPVKVRDLKTISGTP